MLEAIVELTDHENLHTGLLALVGDLQKRFRCDRVAVGLHHQDRGMDVAAISQQSRFDARSAEVRLLADAMVEACEQDAVIHFPSTHHDLQIMDAHRALSAGQGQAEICTVPLFHGGRKVGALLLERTTTQLWSAQTVELFRQIAAMAAPLVAFRQQAERPLAAAVANAFRHAAVALFGRRHLAIKGCAALLLAGLLCAHLLPVTHKVTANGDLVPIERRVITAPIMGYIDEVNVRPGERVSQGDVMLRLDTRDLELERTKWENEIQTTDTEFRSAMAAYDRKTMAVTQARQRQARAQLDLIAKQIDRAAIAAPADGIVMSGDLSQALGAPVELGETLLEIAPDHGYEIHLLVDEKDIAYVSPGQAGTFALAAAPGEGLPFTVETIAPIAEAKDGSNLFRVKTRLTREAPGLRPGQTGVGKVAVGEASLLWVWTHRFVDWFRLQFWKVSG